MYYESLDVYFAFLLFLFISQLYIAGQSLYICIFHVLEQSILIKNQWKENIKGI